MKRASVIIPHYNDETRLRRCLKALTEQSASNYIGEVIVVDNGSDEMPNIEGFGALPIRIVSEAKPGPANARNTGVAVVSQAILAFTDSDCVPAPDWLDNAISKLQEAGPGSVIGGRVEVFCESGEEPNPIEAFEIEFAFDQARYTAKLGFSVTANMVVSAKDFDRVGGFREHVPEDKDWGQRASALGLRTLYDETAVVRHPARDTFDQLQRKFFRLNCMFYEANRQRPLSLLRWLAYTFVVFVSPVAHTVRILFSGKLGGLRQKLGATRILWAIRLRRAIHMLALVAGSGSANDPNNYWRG